MNNKIHKQYTPEEIKARSYQIWENEGGALDEVNILRKNAVPILNKAQLVEVERR